MSAYNTGRLSNDSTEKLEHFEKWLRSKRYSENTIKTYTDVTNVFLTYFRNKPVEAITNNDVIQFNNNYILQRQLSSTYQNQFVNGIKLFFSIVENRKLVIDLIHRPRVERKLPRILSKREIKAILEAPTNLKHRTMLSLIYACGLRRSELLNLRPLKNGTDIRYIQELLGHNSSRTTEIYTHVSNRDIQKIISPFDLL